MAGVNAALVAFIAALVAPPSVFHLGLANPAYRAPASLGQEGLPSHLEAHLRAEPPAALLRPLGEERPEAIVKGYDRGRERKLTEALLAAGLHSRLLRVGVASNGSLTVALVKLQAGDKQSGLFAVADVERDAARVVRTVFTGLPELGHVDVWATVPWQRQNQLFHRPVFSLSVSRGQVADVLQGMDDPEVLLGRCGTIRIESALLDYAVDGADRARVPPPWGEVLAGPAIDQDWLGFSARTRSVLESGTRRYGGVRAIVNGLSGANAACLTIDDGPHPLVTPLMLDILRRENVKATFFVVGEMVEQYPELAKRIVREGHELGNHSYSHIPLSELNPRGLSAQLRGCEVAVERACGTKMRWFRPPGGDCNEDTLYGAQAMGYTTVLWTNNTGDWNGIGPATITDNALRNLQPGGIILMHQDSVESMRALSSIIAGARQAGLALGSVGEVAGEASVLDMTPDSLLPLMRQSHIDW